jgi:hypothetical protein
MHYEQYAGYVLPNGDVTFGLGRPRRPKRNYASKLKIKNENNVSTVSDMHDMSIDNELETGSRLSNDDVTLGLGRPKRPRTQLRVKFVTKVATNFSVLVDTHEMSMDIE